MEKLLESGFAFSPPALALIFALILAELLSACIKGRKNELTRSKAAFVVSIFDVECARTMPKMFRVYTTRVVAGVANFSAFGNRSLEFLKDQPVSQSRFAHAVLGPGNLAVPFAIPSASVVPAAAIEINFNSQKYSLPRKKGFDKP